MTTGTTADQDARGAGERDSEGVYFISVADFERRRVPSEAPIAVDAHPR